MAKKLMVECDRCKKVDSIKGHVNHSDLNSYITPKGFVRVSFMNNDETLTLRDWCFNCAITELKDMLTQAT